MTETVYPFNKDNTDDLPKVLLIGDSCINDVDPERLGTSYGLNVTKMKASKIEHCLKAASGFKADAVVIQTGINDLKLKSAEQASTDMTKVIKQLKRKDNLGRIIVGQVLPTARSELQAKRVIFNALVTANFVDDEDIVFLKHENLNKDKHLVDEIHPTTNGSSIVAANIGRCTERLLWEYPKRNHRQSYPARHWRDNRVTGRRNNNYMYYRGHRNHAENWQQSHTEEKQQLRRQHRPNWRSSYPRNPFRFGETDHREPMRNTRNWNRSPLDNREDWTQNRRNQREWDEDRYFTNDERPTRGIHGHDERSTRRNHAHDYHRHQNTFGEWHRYRPASHGNDCHDYSQENDQWRNYGY
jgi:hypothetical protein